MTTLERGKLFTIDEFHEFADLPENRDKRFELIEGVIYEVTSSSQLNTVLTAWLIRILFTFVAERRLGLITSPDGGFKINERNAYEPDIGFIAKGRVKTLATKGEFPFAPDLAIEVISESERPGEIRKKVSNYLKAGTRLVWVFYPQDQFMEIIRAAENGNLVQTVELDGVLSGEDLLPGFTLSLTELFTQIDDLLKPE